jgi:hypothetical protein
VISFRFTPLQRARHARARHPAHAASLGTARRRASFLAAFRSLPLVARAIPVLAGIVLGAAAASAAFAGHALPAIALFLTSILTALVLASWNVKVVPSDRKRTYEKGTNLSQRSVDAAERDVIRAGPDCVVRRTSAVAEAREIVQRDARAGRLHPRRSTEPCLYLGEIEVTAASVAAGRTLAELHAAGGSALLLGVRKDGLRADASLDASLEPGDVVIAAGTPKDIVVLETLLGGWQRDADRGVRGGDDVPP